LPVSGIDFVAFANSVCQGSRGSNLTWVEQVEMSAPKLMRDSPAVVIRASSSKSRR
jgi:hypothetical protein